MTNSRTLLLAGLLPLLPFTHGCAAVTDRVEAALEHAGVAFFDAPARTGGRAVQIRSEDSERFGRGAVVGPDRVLTVDHVIGPAGGAWVATIGPSADGAGWTWARVVRRIPQRPEPLVELQVDTAESWLARLFAFDGFEPVDVHAPNPGGWPRWIHSARGLLPLDVDRLVFGDSGSPILDDGLRLVGLLTGRLGDRVAVAPLPTPAPEPRIAPRRDAPSAATVLASAPRRAGARRVITTPAWARR